MVDFSTNRKCVRDFLLVINSNLGSILPHFRDIACFLLRRAIHLIPPEFEGCSPWTRVTADVVAPRSEDPRVINLELVQPICPRYVNVTDGRTDGRTDRQTDGRTTYDSNTALCTTCIAR